MLNAIKVNLSRQEIIGATLLRFKDNPLQYAERLTMRRLMPKRQTDKGA